MKHVIRFFIATLMALLFSVNDFAWPFDCDELFTVVSTEQDQDGNTFWSIYVTEHMKDNGTDSMCEAFGRCVQELIATSPQMGAVEIINFDDDGIPSQWNWIDANRAALLAEIDLEERAFADSYSFNERGDD